MNDRVVEGWGDDWGVQEAEERGHERTDDGTPAQVPDWVLPDAPAPSTPPVVQTGPSGLLLGEGEHGPVTIRLFRSRPTRLLLHVPDYISWLLAYRCISLGAHLSVFAQDPRRWQGMVAAVHSSGGTAELLGKDDVPPSSGRPYRPSLVVDDADFYDGVQNPLGHWQALLMTSDAAASGAVFSLRSSDMALISPCPDRVAENLRRAYALTARQLAKCSNLADNEVLLAMPRRLVRLSIPPTQTEYEVLFG
ncbi:MAG: hypothetical protein ACTH2Q_04640 [Propionibacteriaceae bacterium]